MFIFYFNVYDQKATSLENFQIITGLQGPWCEFPKDRNDHKEGSRPEKYNFATYYDLGTYVPFQIDLHLHCHHILYHL